MFYTKIRNIFKLFTMKTNVFHVKTCENNYKLT